MMRLRCPFPHCVCPHLGCVAGWIDFTDAAGNDKTMPCNTCRPEVASHFATAPGTAAQVRRGLRSLARPSRTPAAA
ncbi:hypothetical protein [Nonomuraea sp. NPDC049646]|uniref:hypothetical protein n=1 Tax=unclassified Nonomuraea TaxID=2593643 RepID=UPI00378C58AB